MKQLKVSENWLYRHRFIFGYVILVAFGLFTLFFKLGSLLPGINEYEAVSASTSLDIGGLVSNPINFLFHLMQYVSIWLLGPSSFAIKLPSILLTVVALGLFFYVLEHRFSQRAAIITTLLFVSSSWLLNTVRLGGPMALTIGLVLLLLFISTKLDKTYHVGWLIGLVIAAALSLYSPYFIYLLIAGVILSIPSIKKSAKEVNNRDLYIAGGVMLLLLVPLIYSIVLDFDVAKTLLAIPQNWPTPVEYAGNITNIIGHVIWRSEALPILHLGELPMLEIFSVSMVALGLYHYDHELSKNLSRLLLGGLLVIILILGLNANQFDYAILLPFVYFVLTGGLVILFAQWNEIFPKNPLARVIAIIPIGILLVIVGGYHTERYFVAWANTPEVVHAHSEAYDAVLAELNNNPAYTTVLVDETEEIVMSPLAIYFDGVNFVVDIDEVSENNEEHRLVITNIAFSNLSAEDRKMLGSPTRAVPSQYESTPTVLWIYDVSL